ncbi:MAG: hypothetical protein A2Y00_04250 [Omnitrophica WOR_2 bacterium GWF2_43_52]|nr:MAG: hypothetical protein A2Y00_04250 [Omnitrophica WOR_2 bacterium GWF2_43_52]OGX57839.1 MAG: hypothetical protein A2460_07190 [Omnitrophica WOR_2 bacterium RIFOXYC2_FULL_43_9]
MLCAAVIGVVLLSNKSSALLSVRERVFFIEERLLLKSPSVKIDDVQIWIPIPSNDEWQTVGGLNLKSPLAANFLTEKKYGNKILYLRSKQNAKARRPQEIAVSYKIQRKERGASEETPQYRKDLSRYLKPDKTVPIDGQIQELAVKITAGKAGDLEKAKAIYDYLIDNYSYARDDPKVCGIGNSLLTLHYKKGMCTDWHSLFISLARSLGIPAKFEIGFRVPEGKKEGEIEGYHCWAAFYIKARGWIPLDASEAYKHPEKRDYFFGHIDENRFAVTTGRDIVLKNARNREPVNFFVYPYVEVNGSLFKDVDFRVSFKELK